MEVVKYISEAIGEGGSVVCKSVRLVRLSVNRMSDIGCRSGTEWMR